LLKECAMDERDFAQEIRRAWSLLSARLGIGRSLIWERSLLIDDEFRDVALSRESTYEEVFRVGLSRSSYNIILEDYGYFQFGRFGEEAWRLAYLPNPWLSGVPTAQESIRRWEHLEEIGALSHEEGSSLISEMPYVGAVPPVRFEYSPAQSRELIHPAAHFHIGHHAENRWPSSVSLGPEAFVLIIAKLYYPEAWSRCSTLQGAAVDPCIDETLLGVMANVRRVDLFSDREERNFHFGKMMRRTINIPWPFRSNRRA
jgi:hypothetical protein